MNRLRALQLIKGGALVRPCLAATQVFAARTLRFTAALQKERDAGFLKRLSRRMGWLDHSRSILRMSGYLLYENVADKVDYARFFKEFDMPDTFLSWFVITELHLWMLMVRMTAEGKEGEFVRNCMLNALWDDATVRAKKLEQGSPAGVREQLNVLSEEFHASLFGYDEGLLSGDRVLAGALWRRFFQLQCRHPLHLESLVQFVRQQVKLLDGVTREEILLRPDIRWIAFQKPSQM
ncbi:ubiquinol-cytochrome-c reductase complex assembly factor 1 [Bacillus rossius redtenbacheri]|uniref:ubiquinol-cytochrome-c reductase complex assembly factor 1 n=1 Tax=Bacillus rossius redtenbacheri TaxID=93214 RepID=UPI002FDEC49C